MFCFGNCDQFVEVWVCVEEFVLFFVVWGCDDVFGDEVIEVGECFVGVVEDVDGFEVVEQVCVYGLCVGWVVIVEDGDDVFGVFVVVFCDDVCLVGGVGDGVVVVGLCLFEVEGCEVCEVVEIGFEGVVDLQVSVVDVWGVFWENCVVDECFVICVGFVVEGEGVQVGGVVGEVDDFEFVVVGGDVVVVFDGCYVDVVVLEVVVVVEECGYFGEWFVGDMLFVEVVFVN